MNMKQELKIVKEVVQIFEDNLLEPLEMYEILSKLKVTLSIGIKKGLLK